MGKFSKEKPSAKTTNFKMYKAGKRWIFAFSTLTLLAGGAGLLSSEGQSVHADSKDDQQIINAATAASIHTAPAVPSTAASAATIAAPTTAATTAAPATVAAQPKADNHEQTQPASASAATPSATPEATSSVTASVAPATSSSATPIVKQAAQSSAPEVTTQTASKTTESAASPISAAPSAAASSVTPASAAVNDVGKAIVSKTLAAMPVVDDAGTPSTIVYTQSNSRGSATVTAPNVSIFAGDTSIDKVVQSNFTAFGNGSLATFTLTSGLTIVASTAVNNIDYTHDLTPFGSSSIKGPFLTFQGTGTVGSILANQVGRPNDANIPI